MEDPIVEETREARRQLDAEFGGDLEALFLYLRQIELENGERVVKFSAKEPITVQKKIS
jgi:hypothetical protein